ncbi:CRN-like protein [Plasmopara halstedii]|uniref:CRN-like protein n=1 Tax=Plasmopara halstedii TaxID=4781 RepID=A0A0P1AI55_PLAHL|nr:CRN-like protein [Plasmopara halstedii]CEG40812.1 CRN-like protein [Plasmopara halstedii]|eukprot:XP_024577181.1 CRN-like protein [Plasmopara halstedii]
MEKISGEISADKVHLFLAKTKHAWLSSYSKEAKILRKGDTTPLVKELLYKDKELKEDESIIEHLRGLELPKAYQIHVLVLISDWQENAKKKQQNKREGSEVSCDDFLDALAKKVASMYDFDWQYDSPTVGVVLFSYQDYSWRFRFMKDVTHLLKLELPEYLIDGEWKDQYVLSKRTNNHHVPNSRIIKTRQGKNYMILPDNLYIMSE